MAVAKERRNVEFIALGGPRRRSAGTGEEADLARAGLGHTGAGWIGLDRWPQADARGAEELVVEDGGGHRDQLRLGGPLELGIGRAGKLRLGVFVPGNHIGSGGARAGIGRLSEGLT